MQFVENVNGHIIFHPGVVITSLIRGVCDMVGWWGLLLLVVTLVHLFVHWWYGALDNVDLRSAKDRKADERQSEKEVKHALRNARTWSFDQDGDIYQDRPEGRWDDTRSAKSRHFD